MRIVGAALCLALFGCSHAQDQEVAKPSAFERVARRNPAARAFTVRTVGPNVDALRARGLVAKGDARGLVLRSTDDPREVRIVRAAHAEGESLVYEGPHQTALTFVDAGGIEDLVETDSDVEQTLELPPSLSLRLVGHHGAEIRDEHGRALLRMIAPLAWDARGDAHVPTVSVEGSRLRITVDPQAPRPLLVDPRWVGPKLPALPRRSHATTLLGDGRVLLTGGGTAVTELFDPRTGEFSFGPVLSESRTLHTATLLGDGRVLVVGGRRGTTATVLGSTELVDALATTVTAGPTLTTARELHTGTLLTNGKVLLVGGRAGTTSFDSTEIFDPTTNTVAAGVKLAGTHVFHTATRLPNGKVMIVGPNTELIDATGSSKVAGPTLITPRIRHNALALADGRVLVIDGQPLAGIGALSSTELCGATGACTAGPTTADARAQPSATWFPNDVATINGGVQIGFEGDVPAVDTELLTATSDTLLPDKSAVNHADQTSTALASGAVLVFGGSDPTADVHVPDRVGHASLATPFGTTGLAAAALATGEILGVGGNGTNATLFDPVTKGSALTGAMAEARVEPRALTLDDGKVLVVGSAPASSTAEIYDRTTAKFSLVTATMSAARARPTLTRLPTGKILIAGGGVSTAELFDPKTSTFTPTGSMSKVRGDHAAVLLNDGRVLVAGGNNENVAELYGLDGTFSTIKAPMGLRPSCRGALLPSGRVLLSGGASRQAETFDPVTSIFTPTSVSVDARLDGTMSVLPTGTVLVAGGHTGDPYGGFSSADLYEPMAAGGVGGFVPVPAMSRARIGAVSTLLDDGSVVHMGGSACRLCPAPPATHDRFTEWPATAPRPTVTTAPTRITAGAILDLVGTGFIPAVEPNDGTTGSGSGTPPLAVFVPASGDAVLFGRTVAWTATTMKWQAPATARLGLGRLFVLVRAVPAKAVWTTLEAAPQGSACGGDGGCATGHCVDGVCCDTACTDACSACSASRKGSGLDGVCGAVPPERSPTDACVLGLGAKCSSDAQCVTGHCVDGVCCSSSCTGQCEACDVEGSFGSCVPVLGAPHGSRAACAAATGDACTARVCDGKGRTSCDGFVGSTVDCRAPSCAGGTATLAARCDGSGACPAAVTKACAPYVCEGDTCHDGGCTSDAQCAPDYRCAIATGAARGDCVVRTDAYCLDDHTSIARDGTSKTCDPYRCTPTGCATTCASSSDCLGGFVCDITAKTCVAPSGGNTGGDGGCSTGVARSGLSTSGLLLLALGALARLRRR